MDEQKTEKKKKTEAQTRATRKYNAANYDRIEFVVPKGEKEIIKQYCYEHNISVNEFIRNAIEAAMKK